MKLIKPSQLSFNTWNSVELLHYLCRKLIFLTNHPGWSLHSRIHTKLYNWHLCKAYPRLGEIQQQVYVILVRNSLQKRLVEIISTWLHRQTLLYFRFGSPFSFESSHPTFELKIYKKMHLKKYIFLQYYLRAKIVTTGFRVIIRYEIIAIIQGANYMNRAILANRDHSVC